MKHRPNLGERIAAVESIRSGRMTPEEVALHFDLPPAQVRSWLTLHANDQTVDLGQLRGELRGESGRLSTQAQRLRHLIAHAERTLHDLHAQLLSRKLA
jgi:transposase-like protein